MIDPLLKPKDMCRKGMEYLYELSDVRKAGKPAIFALDLGETIPKWQEQVDFLKKD